MYIGDTFTAFQVAAIAVLVLFPCVFRTAYIALCLKVGFSLGEV